VTPGPAARLVSVHWERIQVIVRLHPTKAGGIDPATVRLQRADDPEAGVGATRAWVDGEHVVVRCNVMQGPGGLPLATGTWELAAGGPGGAPGTVEFPAHVEGAGDLVAVRFSMASGTYGVRTSITGGRLQLGVTLEPAATGERALRLARTLLLRTPRIVLFRAFALAYRLAQRRVAFDSSRILFVGHYGSALSGDMQAVLAGMRERRVDRERAIATVGKRIVLGVPLGPGKPNALVNAFSPRAKQDPSIPPEDLTALSPDPPTVHGGRDGRLLGPVRDRGLGGRSGGGFRGGIRGQRLLVATAGRAEQRRGHVGDGSLRDALHRQVESQVVTNRRIEFDEHQRIDSQVL